MVKRNTLLLFAFIVWGMAGFNILRIGLVTYPDYLSIINYLLSAALFVVFQIFIFGKPVKKYTKRIRSYGDERHLFLKFFDVRSFIIMTFMMAFGIVLRAGGLVLKRFIAFFYTGFGDSLLVAGIRFGNNFVIAVREE